MCSHFFDSFQDLTDAILPVVGDVPVDSEATMVTSSILRICQLSLSEVLTEVGRVSIFIGVSVRALCERLRLYCV
jgi:hypothetical protein